ncbi:MAG: phenylacetate--CoA ligase family protein [Acidobacteria bacterium]|nr:MAG: phenylacetate--CoA ligase family protein [Acidobacteriota bacterium]
MSRPQMKERLAARVWAQLVYPPSLRHLRRHPVLTELAHLEDEQWLPAVEMARLQESRLLAILTGAMASVPYYRQRLADRFGPGNPLDLPRDFSSWPILTRAELAAARDSLVSTATPPDATIWNHTGGSTGEPVSFLQEHHYRVVNLAATARHDRWAGWDFGRPTALLWGADRDLAATAGWRRRFETRWWRRQVEMDAFEVSAESMAVFSRRLRRLRPRVLRGYASALDLFARHVMDHEQSFPALTGIISCAETLSSAMRRRLETVFQCKVFDRYGSREFGLIASQCREGSYHVNSRGVYVEILNGGKPAAPGQVGKVIVTGLVARAMPLVRYDTGDVAEAAADGACACGRGLPMVGRVHGRVGDFVMTPDGRMIHGEFFTHLFYGCRWVRGFTLTQDAEGGLVLAVTGDGDGLEAEMREVVATMTRRLGDGVHLEVRHVSDLPPGPSGKRRFVSSALAARRWADGDVEAVR